MLASTATSSRIAGRFVLESLAGAGGMGSVYRARDEATGQTVAVKLLQAHGRAHENERFAREAELLSKLRHPGVVGYLAHGATEAGEPYIAMEWLEGEDLSHRLARGALPLSESLVLLRRAAEALVIFHEHRVIHRDLKPGNLFLRGGQVERVAILDLGIARLTALSQAMTGTGMVIGTPGYMAPEQARGDREISAAADVFSLGCVLFECLSGKPLFAGGQVMAVLARICFEEPPKLRHACPGAPEAVEALVARMLAKNVADRLPDAAAVLAALDALDSMRLPAGLSAPGAGGEQQLLSVLMVTPPEGVVTAPASPESTLADERLIELHRELSDLGARLEVLADGSLVATLRHARGAATDQAAQTARCALLIKARFPGAAIALAMGRGLGGDGAPSGEVFDRAAALLRDHEGAFSSEQILLDEVTRGLLEVRFVVQKTPSGAHALVGEELALDASRPLLGKPTPCVGREAELGALESALAGCIEEGEPRAALVTAPPGAGKSRILHEFLQRTAAHGRDVTVLIGRGDPMSAGSSYGLLGQAVRRLCGILGGESVEPRRDKLASRIGERVPAGERRRVIAFLGELAGVPFPDTDDVKLRAARRDPQAMSEQITQAMLEFLRAECAAHPVLLVLEDLHWGDALTVKLCEAALGKLEASPLMVLALARPEVDALFPRLWAGSAQVVPLRPLGKRACERLAQQVLGERATTGTVARIVAQSEGNALFLEELIRAVAEGRGDEAPGTVLAMLQARIGRLAPGGRRVIRAASVFGEIGWQGGMRALLGGSMSDEELESWLSRLTQDEILAERRESRFPGEQEYKFRHALMRDAAYDLVAEEECALWHRLAGEYLEARGEPDSLVLAEHFSKAQEPQRAIPYYIQAAERSLDARDIPAAARTAERGLAHGPTGERLGALLSVRLVRYVMEERVAEAVAIGTEALGLLREGSRRYCWTLAALLPASTMTHRLDLVVEIIARLARVEPGGEGRYECMQAYLWLTVVHGTVGMKDAARAFRARLRQFAAGAEPGDLFARGYLATVDGVYSQLIEEAPWTGMVRSAEGQQAFLEAVSPTLAVIGHMGRGHALTELGDHAGAESTLRDSLAEGQRNDEAVNVTYARLYLARLLASAAPLEKLDEAARLAQEVIGANNPTLIGPAYGVLARIEQRRGDLAGAEEEARAACEAVRPFPAYAWELIASRSRILLEMGRAEEALAAAEEGVQTLERLGLEGYGELDLRLALCEARLAAGQSDAADAALADILPRLEKRLADIPEVAARERYLANVPANARIVALAKERLGRGVRA